jgi:PTH1 family peptidyl-tRNA hydrolase
MGAASEQPDRRFIVGLGNPGRRYVGTRHNAGFRVLDVLRGRWGLGDGQGRFDGLVWDTRLAPPRRIDAPAAEPVKVTLLAPMTYMNRSGRAVRQMLDFYKADASDGSVLVVMDDIALPTGRLRLRPGGSAGGQKGLADVLQTCGTSEIHRLRVGIDAPPGRMDAADYVLGKFSDKEEEIIGPAIHQAADIAEDWLFIGIDKLMETCNRRD